MTNLNNNAWPEERVERLKQLWEQDYSCSQIAKILSSAPFEALPTVSRNAAIGKVHRLGLSGRIKTRRTVSVREKVQRGEKQFRPKPRLVPSFQEEPEAEAVIVMTEDGSIVVPPAVARCTLHDLNDGVCRWPLGDPQHPDFHFCGGPTRGEPPYCPAHSRVASGGLPVRRMRRAP